MVGTNCLENLLGSDYLHQESNNMMCRRLLGNKVELGNRPVADVASRVYRTALKCYVS